MAADGLIEQYLDAFSRTVRRRRDRVDLVDEVRDHLLTAAERLEAVGVDPLTAQRRALARFGEPRLVASLFTEVPSKGNLMSLFLSRHLVAMSIAAAAAWIAAAVVAIYGHTNLLAIWTPEAYLASSLVIAFACLLTTAALVGLNVRALGVLDGAAVAIAVLGCLSALMAIVAAWALALWLPLLAGAVTAALVRAWAAHAGSRPFSVALIILMPLLGVGSIIATVLEQFLPQNELLGWAVLALLAAVVAAALIDIAARLGLRAVRTHSAIA